MFARTHPMLIIALLLVAGFGPIGNSAPIVPEIAQFPCEVPEGGKWALLQGQHVTCRDTTITVQSIIVSQLASLSCINSEIIVDAQVDSTGVNGGTSQIDIYGNSYNEIPGYGGALYLDGCLIRAKNPDLKPDGIWVSGGATLIMHNSEIRDFYGGIASRPDPEKIEVKYSRFSTAHDAILLFDAPNVLIEDNLFLGQGDGVHVRDGPTGIIRNNTFTKCHAAVYLYGEDVTAEEISGNTMTSCQGGLVANNCRDRTIQGNDMFRNYRGRERRLPTFDTAICGDASGNWWGEKGPDAKRLGRPVNVAPWRTEPVHPERLPTATIDVPEGVIYAGQFVNFSAALSQPSQTWNSPLATFAWDFTEGPQGHGEVVGHVFHQAGSYEVSVLVTDELGISRMAFVTIDVQKSPSPGNR